MSAPADNLRSKVNPNPGFTIQVEPEEAVLGDKAVGGLDNDKDHVPNVESGLKAALSNPNVSEKAKDAAAEKLRAL